MCSRVLHKTTSIIWWMRTQHLTRRQEMKAISLFVSCLFLSHATVAKFVDELIDKRHWSKVQPLKLTKEQLLLGSDKLLGHTQRRQGRQSVGGVKWHSQIHARVNNTGSNDPKFREVDHVVEYHTRIPTEVGKSDNSGWLRPMIEQNNLLKTSEVLRHQKKI